MNKITQKQLIELGLTETVAKGVEQQVNHYLSNQTPEKAWQKISQYLIDLNLPFEIYVFTAKQVFPNWPDQLEAGPVFIPTKDNIKNSNLAHFMAKLKIKDYREFHAWSVNHFDKFWDAIIKKLKIVFRISPKKICELSEGLESPQWLLGAKLNITESCFTAPPNKIAILVQDEHGGPIKTLTFAELNQLSNRIANSLIQNGFVAGDAIAIDMPMDHFSVAIYLGIIKMGGIVISIADSFSQDEIAMRLRIAKAKGIFTQDFILRSGKKLPLYEKIKQANAPRAIVLPCENYLTETLRPEDLAWNSFLVANDTFSPVFVDPMTHCNILFSSGTTGEPKAIPWNHTTPIKVASDAYFHQNIQPNDILAWPTNLGWMMGPWLIFAALINHATIALYTGAPRDRQFGEFVQNAKVTMLGIVPTIVATWRQSRCMEGLNWQNIKVFSSTGECSNPEDMLYLMRLGHFKPIIEYCGGTEIGGAYLTSTIIEHNYPSLFSTPALGLHFVLLDENKQISDTGEVAIIPPSIGLSTELLNANHHTIYYTDMPKVIDGKLLRRHGDQLSRTLNGCYTVLGRADDTMNLGGIKISSAEIERVLSGMEHIIETAAVAMIPQHGPSQLVIFAATKHQLNKDLVKKEMQKRINLHLNPLFKIEDVVFLEELPKTASNKIMRRLLRKK